MANDFKIDDYVICLTNYRMVFTKNKLYKVSFINYKERRLSFYTDDRGASNG